MAMENIEKRKNIFFSNARKMKPSDREAEHQAIMKEYCKTLEDSDEKVNLANQMHDLVLRYQRKLEQEKMKFKNELEADNKGITEILEKRSLELDQPSTNSSQKENRYSFSSSRSRDNHSHSRGDRRRDSNASSTSTEKRVSEKVITPSSLPEPRPASANSGPLIPQASSSSSNPTPSSIANTVGPVSYNLGHIGAGGNAIAAAASQAIAATQHMQQGRRTASLKASYEAINSGVHAAEFSRELAGAAQTAIAAIQESSKKNKKKVSSANVSNPNVIPPSVQAQQQQAHQQQVQQQQVHQHSQQQQQQQQQQQTTAVAAAAAAAAANVVAQPGTSAGMSNAAAAAAAAAAAQVVNAGDVDNPDWTFDPNEPRYCICNQVSYGDMVACDNSDCPFEWFHYPCVNITAPPKGKWYCPNCTSTMKRRGGRKN